jgi:biopolymer transport protein ExbD
MMETLNHFGALWARYFGLAVIQNTIFLALVLLVLYRLRNAKAGIRYVVGCVGLAKLLLPPFLPVHRTADAALSLPFISVADASVAGAAEHVVAATPAGSLTAAGAAFACWLGITLICLLASLGSSLRLSALLRRAVLVSRDASGGICVKQSDHLSVPVTLLWFPRTIFVPAQWERWSRANRNAAIQHEMAHLRRRDGLVQALQMLAHAMYFFHPLVLYLGRQLNDLREMACDDASVQPGLMSSLEYSRHLVEIAEDVMRGPAVCESASALMRRRSELMTRIEYRTRESKMLPVSRSNVFMLVVGLAFGAVTLSWYQGTASPPEPGDGRNIEVAIEATRNGDAIRVEAEETSLEGFTETIEAAARGERANVIVDLLCEDAVRMGTLFDVQGKLVELGLIRVRFASTSGQGIPHVLPSPEIVEATQSLDPDRITAIVVTAAGKVVIDGRKVSKSQVVGVVKDRVAEDESVIVAVKPSRQSRYENFLEVMSALREADASRVLIHSSTEE